MARNLNRFAAFVAVAALALIASAPAFAQATYPTPSGSRVQGVVPLTCDTTLTNCTPVAGDANGTVTQVAPAAKTWAYAAAAGGITNTTTAVTVAPAAGASVRNYVLSMQCDSDALGAATELAIRDGASGTVIWRTKFGTAGIPNGIDLTFNPPLRGSANTLVEIVTLTATVTGSVYCNLQGYTGS